jgi:DNA-binding beta-propeller fold protein YncE
MNPVFNMRLTSKRSNLALLAAFAVACAAGTFAAKPTAIDLNTPTGTHGLFLVDKLGSRIRFFDPTTDKELSNVDVGSKPHEFAISPDHKTAYVTVYGDGVYGANPHPGHTIAVMDLTSRQQVGTIDVSPYVAPHGIMIDAKGTLYVTCDLSRKLLIIDPHTRTIQAAIDTAGTGHWVTILPDGSKAYVANKNDKPFISVIDLKARKMIGEIPAPNGTQGIAASPDGKRVIAVDFVKPELLVIDPATDEVVDTIQLQGNKEGAFRVRFSPDGKWVVTASQTAMLSNILLAADLHGKQEVVKVGKDPMGVGFSADGRTLLVANHGEGTVSIIDLAEGRTLSQFQAGTGIETLAYY